MTINSLKLKGLTDSEVVASRSQHGTNVLTPVEREPVWLSFLKKFKDPLIIILLVAGILSIGISFYEYYGLGKGPEAFLEPVGIFIAIFLATGLSFIFEAKANKEFDLLNQVNDDEAVQVIRNGGVTQIPRKDVVVGDIVLLNTGDEIPADGQLLDAVTLNIDESTLTGEPVTTKTANPEDFDTDATFPSDRVLRGTKVMEGHGIMAVDAVGDSTENGKVFVASKIDDAVKTPLNEQLDRLGKLITKASYGFAGAIVSGRLLMYFLSVDFDWIGFLTYFLETLMLAVTLIVVAVPEGLPMAVTLSLAYSMRRMLKTNNLVRKLHACETMGATTVICTDKTGTLTQNRMQVYSTDFFGNPPSEVLYEGMAVNSTSQLDLSGSEVKVLGNPTEGALLLWLRERGINYLNLKSKSSLLKELPFTTEHKYMATAVESSTGKRILYVKGAPEIVFGMCAHTAGVTRKEIDALLLNYQNKGMRTLGFAYAELGDTPDCGIDHNSITATNLIFLGVAAISDPVRDDVPEAVREVLEAGIKVKIVTGDTPGTAKEIGRQIGLWNDDVDTDRNIITGQEIAELTDSELREHAEDIKIIARARPMDKKRLVEALQSLNEVVAVTGDGTNDAPALKAAHVGLSMGDGTSVAKEASDITIVDNSFSSIGRAVMWGRSLYRNIQRFILFQLTVNVAACFTVLAGAFMNLQSPLTVTQMLWVNLIMDTFAAMALASLPPSKAVMKERPRQRKLFIITREMWRRILGIGLAFFAVLVGVLYYFEHTGLESLSEFGKLPLHENTGLTPYELSLFFTIFVFLQFWNMFNARAFETRQSAFHFRDCRGFLLIVAIIFIGQILIVSFGGHFFNVVPLRFSDWLIIIVGTSAVLWIGEIARAISAGNYAVRGFRVR